MFLSLQLQNKHLNIIIVSRKALGLLRCDVDVRPHQGSKETLQLLLDPPQFILEPLRLVELDGGLILNQVLTENTFLNLPLFVQHFFLAVDAANNIDIPVVFQTLRTQAQQVGQLEQRLVVGGCAGIRPLQMEGFLLPVVPEELFCPHWVDEALEQADRAMETQRGWNIAVLYPALFRREMVLITVPSLYILCVAFLRHFNLYNGG